METKDLLMKEIERLSLIFKKIFGKMSKSNDEGISDVNISEIGELLKLATGSNLKEIANSGDEEFLTGLLENKLSSSEISKLIDILVALANTDNAELLGFDPAGLARKALFLEDYLMKNQKAVYFTNINSIGEAKKLITKKKD